MISAELENDRFPRLDALCDAVLVNREAVRDIVSREGDAYEIVLPNLEPCRAEGVLMSRDRDGALNPLLRARAEG